MSELKQKIFAFKSILLSENFKFETMIQRGNGESLLVEINNNSAQNEVYRKKRKIYEKFLGISLTVWASPQQTEKLFTFTKEILN